MSCSFNLISHPDRTLEEHLDSCYNIAERVLEMKYISNTFFSIEELIKMMKVLVYFHDFGKGTDFFQFKILAATEKENITEFIDKNKEYIEYFKNNKADKILKLINENSNLTNHAKLGAYYLLGNYKNPNKIIEYILLKIIRKHHSYLTNFIVNKENKPQIFLDDKSIADIEEQIRFYNFDLFNRITSKHNISIDYKQWEIIKSQFDRLRQISNVENQLIEEKSYKYFFLQHFLFSLLLSADKGDMMLDSISLIKENKVFNKDIIDVYKFKNIKSKKLIDTNRESAYKAITENISKFSENNFFSITLPTGLGKTFCAYNSAIILQNEFYKQKGKIHRIIYCLPFTSIIDQNSEILSDIFINNAIDTSLIAKNHYLSEYNKEYNTEKLSEDNAEYLTDGWEHDFIITTFVQLLESIFTNKNKLLRKFHNITNSIIILDEVQNISPKYYEAIEVVFKYMAKYFNTKFIFVTATQPIIFRDTKIIELTDPNKEKTKDFFVNLNRIVLNQSLLKINNYKPIDIEKIIDILNRDINNNIDKSFLIILNTIAQSQEIYNTLKEKYNNCNLIYLSASILPKRRKQLIKLIQRNIKYRKRQIVVSTQVVEAGVDIDFDIVYRDFAPLDCINQSAGRCNRNGLNQQGKVMLFNTGKASRIYDEVLLNITQNILKQYPDNIPENLFYELNTKYFQQIQKSISEQNDVSNKLIEYIQNLKLEDIAESFKIIDKDDYNYNIFIPYNNESNKIWAFYLSCIKIQNIFKRKNEIKKIKSKLLQYVTHFPKYYFIPDENQKDKYIIKLDNWKNYYNLETGFIRKSIKEDTSSIML